MATHGFQAAVILDGIDISAYLTSANLKTAGKPLERGLLKHNPWVEVLPGGLSATFDITGLYDASDPDSPVRTLPAIAEAHTTVSVSYYPSGNAPGDIRRDFEAVFANYTETSPVGGLVAFAATLAVSGAIDTRDLS